MHEKIGFISLGCPKNQVDSELMLEKLDAAGISYMALGCEGCDLCEECTYPTEPCRFPKKAVPSVEACGINVVELSHSIGINYNNGADTVTYFCIILW